MNEITHEVMILHNVDHIKNVMNIQNFINSMSKEMIDSNENITESILARYTKSKRLAKSDEEVEKLSVVKITKALTALTTLKLYEEQQDFDVNSAFNKLLKKHERELLRRREDSQQQGDIRRFFEGDKVEGFREGAK